MSQNDIVDRVLSRLEDRNQINEDVLIEGVVELLEESGVDVESISEEQLDEIFGSIRKAIGSAMTGGEFKDPARRDKDFTGAIKKAGFRRKMAGRQAARAEAAKAQAAQAATAAARATKKKPPMAAPKGKMKPAMAKPAMAKPAAPMPTRKPLSKAARNQEFAATREKARAMRRRDLALESRVMDILADILIEAKLDSYENNPLRQG